MSQQTIARTRTLYFSLRGLKKIDHTDVLQALKQILREEDIEAIQFTQKDCFLTFKSQGLKDIVLLKGLDINGNVVYPIEVGKAVTNVMIRDFWIIP